MNNIYFTLPLFLIFLSFVTCTSRYKVTETQQESTSLILNLTYTGTDDYYLKKTSPIIKSLVFIFRVHSYSDFSFKIIDFRNKRYEVPQEGIFPIDPMKNFSYPINLSLIKFQYTENPFDFKIIRKANNATLFSTYEGEIIYSDYYLQIVTEVSSDYTYGLGERFNSNFRLKEGKWTIFNIDRGLKIDNGQGYQTYGFYPVYLQRQTNNYFHINYFRSSNAMDVIKQYKDNKTFLIYKVIGGILDFRFFLGEQNPDQTVKKFQAYAGRSAMPPFWSLGFHQSRYGYKNVTALQNVLKAYEINRLPLDTIWSDIDYMIDFEDFTIDQSRFPLDKMNKIISNYHYVPIIDAGIKVSGIAYAQGKKRGVFVKDAVGQELKGEVWPGVTTFVDFFHPNASQYWGQMLDILYQKVKFSGIWLDMNQYANFCTGPCQTPNNTGFDYSHDLPYTPGSTVIEAHTIPLNSTHYGSYKQADIHAFAGFLETYATNTYLKSKGLRPFIITRSSTLGSNKFGFHWTGDNVASFDFLRGSIADNFINQMWGMQMVGPDICGFQSNTTQQICSRWFQIGSLYPFARNHNSNKCYDQQPYALGETVLQAARINLNLRYSLLKHYYSLMIKNKGFGTIFTPLFFMFPLDSNTYLDDIANTQFLIGDSLMAAPIVYQKTTSRKVYFPAGNWTDFHTGVQYSAGTSKIDDISLKDKVPLFLRVGYMVLVQDTTQVRQTKDLSNKFRLVAHFQYLKSNSSHHTLISNGSHISLDDYSNDSKIDRCLSQDCLYIFNLTLIYTLTTRTLNIQTNYNGDPILKGLIIIDQITIHYEGDSTTNQLQNPVEIQGNVDITIPIMEDNRKETKKIAEQ